MRIFCSTPDPGGSLDEAGGIWQGGMGLAADAVGNIFLMTGNGPMNAGHGGARGQEGRDVGDSFVRLHPKGDASGYSEMAPIVSQIDLSSAALKGSAVWRVLAPGPNSTDLRTHMAAYASPSYDDSGTDSTTGAIWRPITSVPGDAGAPGGIPDNSDYLLRLRVAVPSSIAPSDSVSVTGILNSSMIDLKLGVYVNGIGLDIGSGSSSLAISIPLSALRIGAANTLAFFAHHSTGRAGFTVSAPRIQITAVHPITVAPGGLFNGNPDDFYAPSNATLLEQGDTDLGSGGPVVLPDLPGEAVPRLLFGVGKDGILRLLNRDALGGAQSGPDLAVASYRLQSGDSWKVFGAPAYWEGPGGRSIYCAASGDVLRQFDLGNGNGAKGFVPVHSATTTFPFPGPSPSVSSDGSRSGTGIVWLIDHGANALRAYDAENVSRMLYSSLQQRARDDLGLAVKFSVPTPVDGRVFVGSASHLVEYGLLAGTAAGGLSLDDVRLALTASVGLVDLTPAQTTALDLDHDGVVDIDDAMRLMLRVVAAGGPG